MFELGFLPLFKPSNKRVLPLMVVFVFERLYRSLSTLSEAVFLLFSKKFAYINIFLYLCSTFLNNRQKPSNLQTFKRRKATFSHKLVRD